MTNSKKSPPAKSASKAAVPGSPKGAQPQAPAKQPLARKGKTDLLVQLLKAEGGATIAKMSEATGWQAHSVRGAIAGSVKKKLGLNVQTEKRDGTRFYFIAPEPTA